MKETLIIKKVIMHFVNLEKHNIEYSEKLINLSDEGSDYYHEKVKKAFCNKKKKEVICNDTNQFVTYAKEMATLDDETFVAHSKDITGQFYDMSLNADNMSNFNILCALVGIDDNDFVFVIKLNHSETPNNFITNKDNQKLVKIWNKQTLPLKSKNVDEALIYDLEQSKVELIEKKFKFEGKSQTYINELYLCGETMPSNKEMIDSLQSAIKNVAGENNVDIEKDPVVKLKKEFIETIITDETKTPSKIIDKVFEDDIFSKQSVIGQLQDKDINLDKTIEVTDTYDKIQKCKVTLDKDISIILNLQDFENKDYFEIIENEDGSRNIVIKNLQSIVIN